MASATPLKLSADIREKVALRLCERQKLAVQGAQSRDSFFLRFIELIEGTNSYSQTAFPGGCDLVDPLTFEAFLSLLASVIAGQRIDPKWTVEALYDASDETAAKIENWLTDKGFELRLNQVLYQLAYWWLSQPYAPLYVGWQQSYRTTRDTQRRHPDTGMVTPDEAVVEGIDYEYEDISYEEVEKQGVELRVPDPCNIYFDPPDVQDIERANAVYEKQYYTEDELWDGIGKFGWDEDQVRALIGGGPTHVIDDNMERQNAREGVENTNADPSSGYYELALCFSRWPRTDGDDKNARKYQDDRFQSTICPERNLMLGMDFSEYGRVYPYILGRMLPRPNRIQGHCVPGMLEGLQVEANANIRQGIDSLNITMSPMTKQRMGAQIPAWSVFPGGRIYVEEMDDVEAFQWDHGDHDALPVQQFLQNRAKALISAQGAGELDEKVRKNGEIQNVLAQWDSKNDLFMFCFQNTIMEELPGRIVSLYLDHMSPGDQQEFFANGKQQVVTAEELRGQYRFTPTATSQTADPKVRLAIKTQALQVQGSYFAAMMNTRPEFWPELWQSHREVLIAMTIRNPETWLGGDPTPLVQQALQAQADAANKPQNQPLPHETINFKDAPAPAQAAMLQQAGLPIAARNGNGATAGNGAYAHA